MNLYVDVKKKLGNFSLNVQFETDGRWHGILGASGCGKSMTLKIIAGIITPDEGEIRLGNKVFFDSRKGINLVPQKRKVGFLFQNYALFPNMTVEKNIVCGIHKGNEERVWDMIRTLRLEGLERRYPSQLSGGQQQRVALARCLVDEPEIMMLDEPFSALDEFLKEKLQQEVKRVLESYDGEVILVSHNRDEVYRFCEKIVILDEGHVVETGETKVVFGRPLHVTAAKLSGCKNISRAKKVGESRIKALDWNVTLETVKPVKEETTYVGIRAHDVVCDEKRTGGKNKVRGDIKEINEDMFEMNVILSAGTGDIWWKTAKNNRGVFPFQEGVDAKLYLPPDKLLLLSGDKL